MAIVIQSVRTTAGFLQGALVDFAPGLTCIIGARGTCKSTLVETMRFAFNCNPDRVELLLSTSKPAPGGESHPSHGLIPNTLGNGRVCCAVEERGSMGTYQITVERELGVTPQIYREGVRELSDSSVLQRLEIYSQGDLQLIAQDDRLRLDLIDRSHKAKVDKFKDDRERHAKILRELGPKIRAKRIEVESKQAEVRGLEGLRAQLAELQSSRPTLSEELDRERAAFQARNSLLERLQGALNHRVSTLDGVLTSLPVLEGLPKLIGELSELDLPEAGILRTLLQKHQEFVVATKAAVQEAADVETDNSLARVRLHFEERNARYYELRKDQQSVNDSLKREDTLKDQISHLERQQAELERMEAKVAELSKQRQAARARWAHRR